MKRILLIFSSLIMAYGTVSAQCAACTPVDCSIDKPAGGLCTKLPDDTAGQNYNEVISFYMPNTLTDTTTLAQCGGCSSVTLRRIDIVGIQGLPPGMTWTASNNGSYDVAGGTQFGCVTFCDTPVAPGIYYITVNLLADVTANGIPVLGSVDANDQVQQYRDTIEIFAGTSTCPGTFSLGSGPCITSSCGAISVDLDATLSNASCPSLISYSWDLGNGQTSNLKSPGTVNFSVPDTYAIKLTTTFYTYKLKQVFAQITGGYCPDSEEPVCAFFDPDPYIRINLLNFNSRGSGDNQNSITITNLDSLVIPVGNCADQLEIQVWDEDTGPPQGTNPVGSQDDNTGAHLIVPAIGDVSSTQNNSSVRATFDTIAANSVTETIYIIVHPSPPSPVLALDNDSICNGDSTILSTNNISGAGYQFQWYLNDTIELPSGDSAVYVKLPGSYTNKITDLSTGCSAISSAPIVLERGTNPPASANILFNGTQLFLSPFPNGMSAEWYYNGNLVPGQTGKFLPNLGDGDYTAVLYNTSFPDCRRDASAPYTLETTGISGVSNAVYNVNVYPNPNNGQFNINFTMENAADIKISAYNLVGQQVFERTIENFSGAYTQEMDMSGLAKGVYTIHFETGTTKINRKVVVQ